MESKEIVEAMNGSELLAQGRKVQEEGHPNKAIALYTTARAAFEQERDNAGYVHSYCDEALARKHLWQKTGDHRQLELFRSIAEKMLEECGKRNVTDKLPTAHFVLASALTEAGEHEQSVIHYREAVQRFQGPDAERGDWRGHLGAALYRSGQKDAGLSAMLAGIHEVREGEKDLGDPFRINVWLSGAYMRLAEVTAADDRKQAMEYLQQATGIVQSDERLVVRRQQLEKLRQRLEQG